MTVTRVLAALLALAVTAIAMVYAMRGHAGDAWQLQAVPDIGWVLAAIGMAGTYCMRAMRLRSEWRGRIDLHFGRCLQVILMHAAAISVLPMRAGELGFPLLLKRHWNIALPDAASSLLWMRLQDMAVIAWLFALSVLAVFAMQSRMSVQVAIAGALLVTCALVLWAQHGAALSSRLLQKLHARHPREGRLQRWLGMAVGAIVHGSARTSRTTWAWSVANWLLKLVTLGGLLAAFTGMSWATGWCGAIAGELGAALPVQPPAGFGNYEAAVVLGATAAGSGITLQRLLAAAFSVHLFFIACALAGALVAWGLAPGAATSNTEDPA